MTALIVNICLALLNAIVVYNSESDFWIFNAFACVVCASAAVFFLIDEVRSHGVKWSKL